MIQIDKEKKITVSLGGNCKLKCAHCYTNTRDFEHQNQKTVDEILKVLNERRGDFTTVCISGDIDCFLDPYKGIELIQKIVTDFTTENIMFTTRIIPPKEIVEELFLIGNICNKRKQLFIPCISVVTFNYPNKIENSLMVPNTIERLEFMRVLVKAGIPCFLTIRPTFPFEIVPFFEIVQILDYIKDAPAAVLGEVLLLDKGGIIEGRLGINIRQGEYQESKLTFINQPSEWKKLYCKKEHSAIKEECYRRGIPFYLRSMSAINYLKKIYEYNGFIKHESRYFDDEVLNIYP